MGKEQLARVAVAAGAFVLVVVAVCSFWFVLPSTRSGSVAFAQEGEGEAPPAAEGGPPTGPPARPPAPAGPAGQAPAAAGAPAGGAPGEWTLSTSPLEPARPNPFAPLDTPEEEVKFWTNKTRYGIDWTRQPIGATVALPMPQIPQAPSAPIPPNPTPIADMVRVSAVMWPAQDVGVGAPGRALAIYEDIEGRSRSATPGSQIVVTHPETRETQRWRVIGIDSDALILRNSDTGEETRMPVQPRSLTEKRYWGAKRMSDDMSRATEAGRVVPGRGSVLPEGGTTAAAGPGAAAGGAEGAAPQ